MTLAESSEAEALLNFFETTIPRAKVKAFSQKEGIDPFPRVEILESWRVYNSAGA